MILEWLWNEDHPDDQILCAGYNDLDRIIPYVKTKLFDFDWEYSNPERKSKVEESFLWEYVEREICSETYGSWKARLRSFCRREGDKFTDMYKLKDASAEVNPYDTFKRQLTEVTQDVSHRQGRNDNDSNMSAQDSSESDGNYHVSRDNLNTFSDLPQGELTDFQNNKYLTSATKDVGSETGDVNHSEGSSQNTSVSHSEGTNESDGTHNGVTTVEATGYQSFKNITEQYKLAVRNYPDIDCMFLDEANELFMGVYF